MRLIRSAASAWSTRVKSGRIPSGRPYRRRRRFATAWNVPPHTRPRASRPVIREARASISREALLVKVSSRMRSGGTPDSISQATRHARVMVLPVPAPATTRTGPPGWHAASRWASFSCSIQVSGTAPLLLERVFGV